MLGVVGIGAYALYRLVTARPRPPGEEPAFQPAPPLIVTPMDPTSYPGNWIGRPPAPFGTLSLRDGTPVRGRLELGFHLRPGEPPPPPRAPTALEASNAPASAIASELGGAGFSNAQIYMTETEARAGDRIPLAAALTVPTPGTRWFAATWRGENRRPLPRQIVMVWPAIG